MIEARAEPVDVEIERQRCLGEHIERIRRNERVSFAIERARKLRRMLRPQARLPKPACEPRPKPKRTRARVGKPTPKRVSPPREEPEQTAPNVSGPAPFGYERVREGNRTRLVFDARHARVVRWLFSQYLRCQSLVKLCRACERFDLWSARGLRFTRSSLSCLFKNRIYGHGRRGEVPALIGPVIFNKVNLLMKNNDKKCRDKWKRRVARRPIEPPPWIGS